MAGVEQTRRMGSFRAAEFHVTDSEARGGRNIAVHPFPQERAAKIQNLSPIVKRFNVTCFVVGPDYLTLKEALQDALDAPDSATLQHPFHGRLKVSVDGEYTVNETNAEGGKATFTIPFIRDADEPSLNAKPDTASAVRAQGDATKSAGATAFANQFKVAGQPSFVAQAAAEAVNAALSKIQEVAEVFGTASDVIATIDAQATAIQNAVESLILAPLQLANQFTELLDNFTSLTEDSADVYSAYESVFAPQTDPTAEAAPVSVVESTADENEKALARDLAITSVSSAIVALTESTFETQDESDAIRVQIGDTIDSLIEEEPDDEVIDNLQNLRATYIADYYERSLGASRVVEYVTLTATNTLRLAYDLYGDLTREEEIISLNKIIHPGFIPGGTVLRVLNV